MYTHLTWNIPATKISINTIIRNYGKIYIYFLNNISYSSNKLVWIPIKIIEDLYPGWRFLISLIHFPTNPISKDIFNFRLQRVQISRSEFPFTWIYKSLPNSSPVRWMLTPFRRNPSSPLVWCGEYLLAKALVLAGKYLAHQTKGDDGFLLVYV